MRWCKPERMAPFIRNTRMYNCYPLFLMNLARVDIECFKISDIQILKGDFFRNFSLSLNSPFYFLNILLEF